MENMEENIIKKSWVIRWICFILLFTQLFVWISYIMRPINVDRRNFTGYYAEKTKLDIVCIGASSTFVYWSPLVAWQEFGITSYNLAHRSMPPESFLTCLQEALKYQKPTLIILDIRPFIYTDTKRSESQIRFATDNMNYSFNRNALISDVVPDRIVENGDTNLFNYIFDISKYHTNWKALNQEMVIRFNNRSENYLKGFEFEDLVDMDMVDFVDVSNVYDSTPPDEYILCLFEELLSYVSTLETEVIFTVSPYDEGVSGRERYNYYESRILEMGWQFINTNNYLQDMDIDSYVDYFYDSRHMNIFGAEKYTKFLGTYILQHFRLQDHRDDEAYHQWNEDYIVWEQQVGLLKESLTAKLSQ